MRKLLIGILLLLVVIVAAAVALPFVLPRETIKAQIESRASEALGRSLRIEGPLELRPWRPFALTLTNVSLANPAWAEKPVLARIPRVELEVDALAYLSGTLALERLIIESPALAPEIGPDGTPSWQFASGTASGGGGESGGGGDLPEIRIGEIRVTDGTVELTDHGTGESRSFTDIELWARSEAGSPALNLDASVASAGERATLNAAVGNLNELLAGEPSSLTLDLSAPGLGLAADGEASPSGAAVLALTADMAPRVLLDWLGVVPELPEGTLETARLTVDVAASPAGLGLGGLALDIDDLRVTGDLDLALGERPRLSGTLDLGDLDLEPFIATGGTAAADGGGATSEGWPTEPLDLPLPLPLDIDLDLAFSSLRASGIELGAGTLAIGADQARTAIDIGSLALYDGGLTGGVALTTAGANGGALGLDAHAEASGIQLQPLLAALADTDFVAGTGNFRLAATSSGESVDALVRGLNGEGMLLARDGAIMGINIGATMRQVMTLGTQSAANEPRRTDFAETGGTFTITNGVLANDDFSLRAPVLRVSGEGTVDLGAQSLDYRLLPRVAATLQGQDAAREDAFQAGVPIRVDGPWADPAIRLDLDGMLSADIGDPAALTGLVSQLASDPARLNALRDTLGIGGDLPLGQALEGLGGLLGGGSGSGQGGGAPASPGGRLLESLGGALRR